MRKKVIQMMMFLSLLFVTKLQISATDNLILGDNSNPLEFSSTIQILIFLTFLTFLPAIVLTMTSFTRTVIVFSLLRSGLGTQTTPPNQVIIGLSLFLTFFIMAPVVNDLNENVLQPYIAEEITQEEFVEEFKKPIQNFMLKQTRAKDLELFVGISEIQIPQTPEELPLHVVIPAFIISELKTAFEIGFLLLIPFIVIDFIVSSVLMSMGMFMLPPVMISLPFKILLFVLVDGWYLIVKSLVESFTF